MTRCARASWRRSLAGTTAIGSQATEMRDASAGREKWQALQSEICAKLAKVMDVRTVSVPQRTDDDFNTLAAFLSGFVSVCDWIGSDSEFFPFEGDIIDLGEHWAEEQTVVIVQDL